MFRLFIDEIGHHDMRSSADPNQRYLGLTGVIMRLEYADKQFTDCLNALKQQIFGRSDFPLHRREIMEAATAPYTILRDQGVRGAFDAALLAMIDVSTYRAFTVVIDKQEHKTRYLVWQFQPYHYCMTVMLERYVLWLKRAGEIGDVMAESRGKTENKQLAKAYRWIYKNGTDHVAAQIFQERLSSKELKLKRKTDNIAGLQLSDLLANPSGRELICRRTGQEMTAEFGRQVVAILYDKKYLRSPYNWTVQGWGTKFLP